MRLQRLASRARRTSNAALESGKLDFAMGSYPSLPKTIRRQPLWVERYVSVARRGHPRLSREPTLREIRRREACDGFDRRQRPRPTRLCKRALEAAVPRDNIVCRIPIFTGAAVLAKQHRYSRHIAAVGGDRPGQRSRPADHHAAGQAAEDRYLSVLARAISQRPRQPVDQGGIQGAVSQHRRVTPAAMRAGHGRMHPSCEIFGEMPQTRVNL